MSQARVRILTTGKPSADLKVEDLENAMELKKPVHLYWVTVADDPGEDWFVLATRAQLARQFFEEYEGFESREAEARLVERTVHVQALGHSGAPRWAELSDLEALGFEILSRTPHLRSVRKGRETFVEGYLESEIVQARDNSAEAAGKSRPFGTRWQGEPN